MQRLLDKTEDNKRVVSISTLNEFGEWYIKTRFENVQKVIYFKNKVTIFYIDEDEEPAQETIEFDRY